MKAGIQRGGGNRGISLVETMVSIGVLAVVAPLALAAMLKAGETGTAAKAETRAPVIVEACLAEIRIARDSESAHLPKLNPGEAFGTGDPLSLAFRRDGTLAGAVPPGGYETGIDRLGSDDIAFLATVEGDLDTSRSGFPDMLKVTVTVEAPATAPVHKRKHLEFVTKLP
ncbi:hypothetical protein [Luteolibacter marinus]|uniref:hypothetical protein n=1 Tax=Luteolibacter marinus TaxID=2776705 RepID=UPI00186799BB|nr:hypothetical protein [Luteolibacter marinus]